VIGTLGWRSFGWFASFTRVVVVTLVWPTLVVAWLAVRGRLG
jgi:hypothetical protein